MSHGREGKGEAENLLGIRLRTEALDALASFCLHRYHTKDFYPTDEDIRSYGYDMLILGRETQEFEPTSF